MLLLSQPKHLAKTKTITKHCDHWHLCYLTLWTEWSWIHQTHCCTCTILVYCRCLILYRTFHTEWCFSCLLVKYKVYWKLQNTRANRFFAEKALLMIDFDYRPFSHHMYYSDRRAVAVWHLLIQTIVCISKPAGWFSPVTINNDLSEVYSLDFTSLYDIMFIHFIPCLASLGSCTRQLRNWLLIVTSTSCCRRTAAGKELHSSQPWAAAWDKSWTINRKYIFLSRCYLPTSLDSLSTLDLYSFVAHCLLFFLNQTSPVSVSRSTSCFSLSTWERGDSFLCCVRSQRVVHYVVVRLCLISHCTNSQTPKILAFFISEVELIEIKHAHSTPVKMCRAEKKHQLHTLL